MIPSLAKLCAHCQPLNLTARFKGPIIRKSPEQFITAIGIASAFDGIADVIGPVSEGARRVLSVPLFDALEVFEANLSIAVRIVEPHESVGEGVGVGRLDELLGRYLVIPVLGSNSIDFKNRPKVATKGFLKGTFV